MNLYTFNEPQKIQAGNVGANETPIYWPCCECKSELIAGFAGSGPNWQDIAVLPGKFPFVLALYCQEHLPATETA